MQLKYKCSAVYKPGNIIFIRSNATSPLGILYILMHRNDNVIPNVQTGGLRRVRAKVY